MSIQSQFDYLLTRIERLNPKAVVSGGTSGSGTVGTSATIATTGSDNNSFFSSNNIIFSQLKSTSNINNNNSNSNNNKSNKNNSNNNVNNNKYDNNHHNHLSDFELDESIISIINDTIQLYHSQQQQQQQQQQPNTQQQQQLLKDYYIRIILKLCQYVNNNNNDSIALKYFQMTILLAQNNQLSLQEYSNELAPLLQMFQKYIQLNTPNTNTNTNTSHNNNNNSNNNIGSGKHMASGSSSSSSSSTSTTTSTSSHNQFQSHQYTTVRIEALKALSILLYNNGPSIPSKFHQPLFDSLLLLANLHPTTNNPSPLSINQETKRLATISIGNLCVQCGSKLSKFYPLLFDKLYSNLEKLVVQLSNDQHIIKFTCSTLRSLQLILTQCKGVYDNKASSLLSILKRLMFFGTSINPNAVLPSQLHSVEPYKLVLKKKKNRDIGGELSDGISSSDSDIDERYSFAKLIRLVSPFLSNAATDVQLASLSSIIAILSAEPPTPDELQEFLASNDIVERIIQFASNPANTDHMRIEATQCILALTKHNFQMFCKHHESIYTTLFGLLTTPTLDSTLRIQSSKTIEEISKSIHESQKSNITYEPNVEKRLWDLFFKSLTGLIEDPLPQIRSSICNCLSHLTSNVFANLPIQLQLHSVTVILGLMSDDSYLVRASSCRTIGMFVKLETLADDTTFLSKAASCLYKSMCDNNINIRIKACWSLANLCDHLVSIRKDEVFNDIPTLILSKVVEVLLLASYDNPKVRSNAVRALGNFARFAPRELLYNSTPVDIQDIFETIQQNQQLQNTNGDLSKINSVTTPPNTPGGSTSNSNEQNSLTYNHKNMMDHYIKNHHKSLIDRIIDSLVINAAEPSTSFNFVKVKWNACYALGNLFYNSDIQFDPTPKWLHQIYETLVILVQNCKNYKIKINASASLATPTHNRLQYGEDYQSILETIINSLSNVNTLVDHSEYQYKDILERQLGVSLIHLLGEMTYDEIETYQTLLLNHSEIIYETFEKLNPTDQIGKKQDRPTAMEYNQGMATINLILNSYMSGLSSFNNHFCL
ncbi:HEAT repeat-containing protein [Heterostelium album PN500]|uniref:HEAT repeat-containing protein n=1 Tax=Heterostelium pallidum (strain ATCC 26659 / Pp 5 / PN500) TaxID=670386 RepID=D3B2P5_HETP5|nr:HEAT repeat-containing protein [Heterostelium album PN500]EFA83593.1 HEAT repeat-containing protein [Heterostelium album PN500]|eukprot:XP_020435710.1 HEAT repeat-containing protein [Heterostelium album PN500]